MSHWNLEGLLANHNRGRITILKSINLIIQVIVGFFNKSKYG